MQREHSDHQWSREFSQGPRPRPGTKLLGVREAPKDGWFAHSKGDGRYILDKQPTFMIPYPGLTPRPHPGDGGFEKSFIELFKLPEFERDYEFRTLLVEGGLYINYYQRK